MCFTVLCLLCLCERVYLCLVVTCIQKSSGIPLRCKKLSVLQDCELESPINGEDVVKISNSFTASNLCLLLQKEQNVKGGEGPSGKQAVGINNGTR